MYHIQILLLGYPVLAGAKQGTPGDPPVTQWRLDTCHVHRLQQGQHLLYREATGGSMSGSPLYFIDGFLNIAYVLGVHVGGSKFLANAAVPISHHMRTDQHWSKTHKFGLLALGK